MPSAGHVSLNEGIVVTLIAVTPITVTLIAVTPIAITLILLSSEICPALGIIAKIVKQVYTA
jgi:hypothetical protein